MGLRAALVDRAVRLRKDPTGRRVEGTTIYEEQEAEQPVRVRLTVQAAGEDLGDGRSVTEPTPTLMVYRKDLGGQPLDWRATDRVRVTSRELGEAIYEVDGEPVPIRKKRRVIGWTLTVKRVEENRVEV